MPESEKNGGASSKRLAESAPMAGIGLIDLTKIGEASCLYIIPYNEGSIICNTL